MGEFENLHQILLSLYEEMMPLCSDMAGVAKGLAGLGALFYVAMRVWQSLARAEAIDVYPLLRPFAIGLCILFFPTVVLGTMNSVLGLVVEGTHSMLEEQTFDMNRYREQKDRLEYEAMMRNPETAYLASDEEFDRQIDELGWSPSDLVTMTGMYMDWASYSIKKSVRDWFRERLEIGITSLEHQGNIIPVELEVYDNDGQAGIFIPGSMEIDAAKEIGANMGSSLGSSINISTDAGAQLASDLGKGVIQGVSQYISKRMRTVRVHLKSGYRVLLYQEKE